MDDLQAFERQVADAFVHRAGPVRQVDAAAIFAAASTPRSQGWGFGSLYGASRLLLAGLVVALFGGVLLQSILLAPAQDLDSAPAASASASPASTQPPESVVFPTGTFVSESGDTTLVFRPDGTCERAGVACTFGVNEGFYAEMSFEDASATQVPATYAWQYDGERLTFEPWGDELQPDRLEIYADHIYRPVSETLPLPQTESDFPTGQFRPNDGSEEALLIFDGRRFSSPVAGGLYAVNGDLLTFMTVSGPPTNVALVPATYHWSWSNGLLTFRVWGQDDDPWRTGQMLGRVYVQDDTGFVVLGDTRRLFLTDPRLEYFVTVEIRARDDGRFEAASSIDDEPLGAGVGATQREAVRAALEPLGEPYASDLSDGVSG